LPDIYAGTDTTICSGDCVTLNASGGETYIWSNGDTTSWTVTCPASDSNYYVTAYDDIGCSSSDSVSVFVNPLPVITLTPDTGLCEGDCITLSATGGISYLWDNGDTTSTITVCPESFREYFVEVKNETACSSIDSVSVDVYPNPQPGLPDDTTVCQYDCIYLVAHDGNTYLWSNGKTTDSILVCPQEEEAYFVDVTGIFGCKASDTTHITTIPATEAYIYDLIPVYCNTEDSVKLHAYPSGGEFFGEGVSNPGDDYYFDPKKVTTGLKDIIYKFTNEFGCPFYDTAIVTVNETPFVNLGNDTTVCNDQLLTLSAPPGFDSYLWWNGTSTNMTSFFPDELGIGFKTIDLIVTQNGCTFIAEKNLEVIVCNPGISENSRNPEFNIYPVPAKTYLHLEFEQLLHRVKYEIVDIFGKVQINGEFNSNADRNLIFRLDVSGLNYGLYLIILKSNNYIFSEKFLISR
jgi:hypothetical protein